MVVNFTTRGGQAARGGKVLVLLAILLPSAIGILGLVIDGGLMMVEHRKAQHAADAAALAAAVSLVHGKDANKATAIATEIVEVGHSLSDATVRVYAPPQAGQYAGQLEYVEVIVSSDYRSWFFRILDGVLIRRVEGRAVAGGVPASVGAAIVVLDPDPASLSISNVRGDLEELDPLPVAGAAESQSGILQYVGSIPGIGPLASQIVGNSLGDVFPSEITSTLEDVVDGLPVGPPPSLLAGLEVEGLGSLQVDGAIYVNSEWGQVDQFGKRIGTGPGPPYAIACTPTLPLTRVTARDIRVVGGVDNEKLYGPFEVGGRSPLQAGRLPVDDPLESLPIPSVSSDPDNVSTTLHNPSHAVRLAIPISQANSLLNDVLGVLPILGAHAQHLRSLLTEPTLTPGVYDSITIISPLGGARLEPGVYIIRGRNPHTKLSLCLVGPVQAEGVMFYISNSPNFDVMTGSPDGSQPASDVPPHATSTLVPSVLVAPLLPGGKITGLQDPESPFHEMLIYQHRQDRRPIVIEAQQALGGGSLSGTIYSKWGHTLFLGGAGSYDLRFVTGTLRVVTVTNTTIAPERLLPAARDVLLVE